LSKNWLAKSKGKRGGQFVYSNKAIEIIHLIRGFNNAVNEVDLPILDYTTLSRRLKSIRVNLSTLATHKTGTHIIIDGSGLSIYGEPEIREIEGKERKFKGYRRIHLCINEHQEITACELTTSDDNEKNKCLAY